MVDIRCFYNMDHSKRTMLEYRLQMLAGSVAQKLMASSYRIPWECLIQKIRAEVDEDETVRVTVTNNGHLDIFDFTLTYAPNCLRWDASCADPEEGILFAVYKSAEHNMRYYSTQVQGECRINPVEVHEDAKRSLMDVGCLTQIASTLINEVFDILDNRMDIIPAVVGINKVVVACGEAADTAELRWTSLNNEIIHTTKLQYSMDKGWKSASTYPAAEMVVDYFEFCSDKLHKASVDMLSKMIAAIKEEAE